MTLVVSQKPEAIVKEANIFIAHIHATGISTADNAYTGWPKRKPLSNDKKSY